MEGRPREAEAHGPRAQLLEVGGRLRDVIPVQAHHDPPGRRAPDLDVEKDLVRHGAGITYKAVQEREEREESAT